MKEVQFSRRLRLDGRQQFGRGWVLNEKEVRRTAIAKKRHG
jgi:hypothetical protein